jgi:predicted enzyme related to lactoylglutathione lyase
MPRVCHFEIHADDPEKAVAFYQQVFGWEIQRWEGGEYWLIRTGPDSEPGINGGLLRRRHPIDGEGVIAYVCTVAVPALEETLEKVAAAGGTLAVPRMAVPGVGWLAYAKDTQGNVFGMLQADPGAR